MTYNPFDVVSVPFPFTDQNKHKKRPALILSSRTAFNDTIGHSIMAMITSAKNSPWPLDVKISDLKLAGLLAASVVRMKLFTLDHRFIFGKIGSLVVGDQKAVSESIRKVLKEAL